MSVAISAVSNRDCLPISAIIACLLYAGNLDELIQAHQQYVDIMLRKSLLDDGQQQRMVRILDSVSLIDESSQVKICALSMHYIAPGQGDKMQLAEAGRLLQHKQR